MLLEAIGARARRAPRGGVGIRDPDRLGAIGAGFALGVEAARLQIEGEALVRIAEPGGAFRRERHGLAEHGRAEAQAIETETAADRRPAAATRAIRGFRARFTDDRLSIPDGGSFSDLGRRRRRRA
ncbi:hypothetical protein [Salinarimonas sp.]|uniref:hypothetical protein n=1 Tax=Salinarimonas sp. TaxID=2766526 RepID=UPI0032D960F6